MRRARSCMTVLLCALAVAIAWGAHAQDSTQQDSAQQDSTQQEAQQDSTPAPPSSNDERERNAETTDFEGSLEYEPGDPADESEGARDAEGKPEGIEEIIITAERREAVLQETPVAITVFDQAQLDQRGVSDLQGLSFNVPNFHYGEVLGQARITIRGISTAGGDQAAAFHVDGIYQDSSLIPSSITFFDLARVETLRGPQGTLAGRNATGGAIFLVTQPPEFDFALFGDITFGNYHEIITRGVLNVPIVEDKVAARLSVIQDRHYGYTENLQFDVRSRDVDDRRLAGLRSQIRVQPIDSLDWVVRSIYSRSKPRGGGLRIDGDLPASVPVTGLPPQNFYATGTPNPSDVREIYLDTAEQTSTTLIGGSSTLTWEAPTMPLLGDTAFTVMGSWQRREQASFSDVDRTNATAFGIVQPLVTSFTELEQEEWVVEANWTSQNSDQPISWVAGAFYLGTKGDLDIATRSNLPFTVPFLGSSLGVVRTSSITDGSVRSVAGFFDASYEFLDEFTFTGGFRYSVDWKAEKNQAAQIDVFFLNPAFAPLNPLCVVAAQNSDKDDKWGEPTGRAMLQWQYTEDNMVYGSYSRGYKAGTIENSVPAGCNTPVPLQNTDPETINAYELGFKNEFFDNRLQANLTGFYYDYNNIQVSTLVQSTVVTQNAAGAEVAGVELELTGLPLDELLLTLNFAYLYSNFTDYTNGCLVEDASTCVPGGFLDFTGNQLPRAPRLSGTVTAQYTWDLDRFGTLIPFAQIYASDKIFFRAANLSTDEQKAYWLLDTRLGWESPGHQLMLEVFVANALDKNVVNTKLISTPLLGSPQLTAYAPPRTFGTRVTLRW